MATMPPLFDLALAVLAGLWLAAAGWALTRARSAPARAPRVARDTARDPIDSEPDLPREFANELAERIVHHTINPLWWRNANLDLAGANRAYARAVGADSPEDAVRRGMELAPAVRSLAARARASGKTNVIEERVMIAGVRRLTDIIHIPLSKGEVAGFALDASEREPDPSIATRDTLALGEAFDHLAPGVAIFDDERTLVFHNLAFVKLFGLERVMLDARPDFDRVLDLMREAGRLPEQRDFPAWRAARRGWFAPGASAVEEGWQLPGGERVRVRAEPRSKGGLILAFDDETERVLLAGERDALVAVHQATLDHLSEGVAVFGPGGQLRSFNRRFSEMALLSPAMLNARPTAEALMERLGELLDQPDQAANLRDIIGSATAGRVARGGRFLSAAGDEYEYGAVPLPDGNALLTIAPATPAP